MVDLLALVALVVSLVALLVTILQMAQQYAATAADYRLCSERTMGKWGKCTHRRWIWNEFRFEVTFSTPRITCAPPSTDFKIPPPDFEPENPRPNPPSPPVTSSVLISEAPIEVDEQYNFVRAPKRQDARGLRAEKIAKGHRWWYLDGSKAVAEGKCSWLTLLEDTIFTDARFTIREIRSSFDFVPPGITKPPAFADKSSLLTLMSLFGIKWKDRGEQRELVGAGDFCELTIRNSPDLKESYIYSSHRKVDWSGQSLPGKQKYYLLSDRARKAMFHCFDLGFATFCTHSADEITSSMKDPSLGHDGPDGQDVEKVAAFYRGAGEWCPGLSESITCWAVQSMPKMVDKENDKFKSVFSAISAISLTTGRSKFANILLGGDNSGDTSRNNVPAIRELTDWARDYWLGSLIDGLDKECVIEGLKYAASSDVYQNISDREIPWKTSRICLKGVRLLDDDLDGRLLEGFTNDERRSIKRLISKQQIKYGSQLFTHADEAAKAEGSFWVQELDRVGAKNYITIASDITEKVGNATLARMIVVNRLMRGSLWVIHNGNAPNQGDRRLECSLSSTWLLDNSTVYIT